MKKLLILLAFFSLTAVASSASAQYYPGGGYGYGYGSYYLTKSQWAYYATENFFNSLGSALDGVDQWKAAEANLNARRNNLENSKSVQNFVSGNVPPFAPVAPSGKPRPPQITWQDVQNIRWQE